MNIRLLLRNLSYIVAALAALFLPSCLWAVYFQEWGSLAGLLESMIISVVLAGVMYLLGRGAHPNMYQREALLLVALGWLVVTILGALPFYLSGGVRPLDAFFESMSGFTTTGATILVDIEATPKSLLFWRSFTHWLGGIGIVLIFIAVFPYLGAGGRQLFQSESSRPNPSGRTPRIGETAKMLYKVYVGLTAVQTLLLMLAGMSFFDALCHTFGTLASGGFSTRQASIAAFDSAVVEWIIIFFMFLAATNFGLLFALYKGNLTALYEDTEWRVYLGILCGVVLLVAVNLVGMQGTAPFTGEMQAREPGIGLWHALRISAFGVTSLMTTTGFTTVDYDAWPHFSRFLLLIVMVIGGSAGSTAGGVKVLRIVLLVKMLYWRVERTFRPHTKRAIRISGEVVNEEIQTNVYAFVGLYALTFIGACALLSLVGLPIHSAISAVAATINGVGPGMEHLGASEDYHLVPAAGKLILCACMLMGRLELFTIYAILLPGFWVRS